MNSVEDRTSRRYKAQEQEFYSNQWAYNSRIKEDEDIIKDPRCSAEEKAAVEREINDLKNDRQDSIDCWKEEHGAYDEEMTKWTIDEAAEHEKNGDGLGSLQAHYDENQYGHVQEHEEEEEQGEEFGY